MVNIFNDTKYAVLYEQSNLDLGDIYGQFASTSTELAKMHEGSKVLDLGCGTGVSTTTLFKNIPRVKVVAVDQSNSLLDMALLKFGLLNDPDTIYRLIRNNHPFPEVVMANCHVKDLEDHLKEISKKFVKYQKKVKFYHKDASQLINIPEGNFDYVLASQVIPWLRKKDAKPGQLNLDYEKSVIQQVREKLRSNGIFVFNTSGASFKFDNADMNESHIINHPFYKAFMDSIYSQLSLEQQIAREYVFDNNEIKRIMNENGFEIKAAEQTKITYSPNWILEVCLVGGHLRIFQKYNIESKIEEREIILKEALDYALKKISPEARPVVETGIHYVAEKIN